MESSKDCINEDITRGLTNFESLLMNNYKLAMFDLKNFKDVYDRDVQIKCSQSKRNYIKYNGEMLSIVDSVIHNKIVTEANKEDLDTSYRELKKVIKVVNDKASSMGIGGKVRLARLENYDDILKLEHNSRKKYIKFYNKLVTTFFTYFAEKYAKRGIHEWVINNDFYFQVLDCLLVSTIVEMSGYLGIIYRNAYTPLIFRIKNEIMFLNGILDNLSKGITTSELDCRNYKVDLVIK